jgi:hypothetical protein
MGIQNNSTWEADGRGLQRGGWLEIHGSCLAGKQEREEGWGRGEKKGNDKDLTGIPNCANWKGDILEETQHKLLNKRLRLTQRGRISSVCV